MAFWRRRRQPPQQPVVLPSLDRLSGLIERVVELVDAVADTSSVPAPEPVPEPAREAAEAAPERPEVAPPARWLALVSSPDGYRLAEQAGGPPEPGETTELEGVPFRVLRFGPSPLPRDARRCAYLEREATPAEPTPDA